MPYLKQKQRDSIDDPLDELANCLSYDTLKDFLGALNYVIFTIVRRYLKRNETNYAVLASIIGTLDCAKEEVRRRIVNPYEDNKIQENGDVV